MIKKLNLIQRFSLVALLAMITFGYAFGKILSHSMSRHMFHQALEDTADLVTQNVVKHFEARDLTTVKSGPQYKEFTHEIGHLSLGANIEQIKIWNRDMAVVWSDDESIVGRQFPDKVDLKRALGGELSHEVTSYEEFSSEYNFDHKFQSLLELYVPIKWEDGEDVEVVFEVYQNIDRLNMAIMEHTRGVWFWTVSGFAALYIILFGIVWNASRRLERQTRELRQSKQDWEDTFNSITDVITVHDNEFNIIQSNRAANEILGIPTLNGTTKCYKYFHGAERPPEECAGDKCCKAGRPAAVEMFEPHLNRYIEVRAIPRFGDHKKIDGLIHVVRDISQRKNDEMIIKTQLARLNALRSIDKAIIGSIDLNVTLDIFLDQVMQHLGIDAASVLLLSRHSRTLKYAVSKGFRSIALRHTRLRLGEGNAGRAALEKKIIKIDDLNRDLDGFSASPHFADEGFAAYFAVPLISKGQVRGVLELFHRTPKGPDEDWLAFLEAIADQGAIAVDNANLFEELQTSNTELMLAYETTIEGWSRALDLRDKETEGHTQRVSELTVHVARQLRIRDEDIIHIRRGALLHDIGKMGVPDSILLKPGPLSDEEWKIMKLHPVYAYQMIYPIEYLRPAIDIPYYHHEKWDGSGYPKGLKGDEIPVSARIFAIVDVWDALRSDRPYRSAWPREKVADHIRSLSGTHFDPALVGVFLEALHVLEEKIMT
ncbi:MAG: HD domain-containing protein [Nitrospiraceae bacterium]|nr:MAG: HD domain-containing protein [Nitrospiraceae bacterium]